MLKPGIIPNKEPLIRVGVVLPEDRKEKISLELPSGEKKEISIEDVSGIIRFESKEKDSFFILHDVTAGRGFHWNKFIEVRLPHAVEVYIKEDFLVVVNELPLETYLSCVATSEMSGDCPPAFIEAQTIVARSWMLANIEQKHVQLGFDVCNDDCCQRYQGLNNITDSSIAGSRNTHGKVLIYGDSICDARYSKSCGGIMESFENLWEGPPLPYMQNITDGPEAIETDLSREPDFYNWVNSEPATWCSPHYIPEKELKKYLGNVDEAGNYFRWKEEISQEELCDNLNNKLELGVKRVISIDPLKRAGSGRLLELRLSYIDKKGEEKELIIYKDYEIRRLLHKKFLYSSAIAIETTPLGFRLKGAGWGHGAGLCQIGAIGMSLHGKSAEEIVFHYYPGSELKKIY